MVFFRFHHFSISKKIAAIVIFSWLLITVLITSFFVGQELYSFRKTMVADLNGLARVIGVNCAAPLEFNDAETAAEVLSSLSARPKIHQAALYSTDEKLFARYLAAEGSPENHFLPKAFPYNLQELGGEAFFFKDKHLDLFVPVRMQGTFFGTLLLRADLSDFSKKITDTAFVVGGIMVASLFFAWIVSAMLQRYISNPIQEMAEAMRRVRNEKKYSIRIKNEFTDEFGTLADGFNSMLDHIQERDEQLLDAKQVAEEANRAKSMFLAQMSHEIRTPMNAIIGMTYLAIDSNPDEKILSFLKTVQTSANSLLGILNDILDFSKIEAGQLLLSQQSFLLRSMLETVISTMNISALEKGIKLQYVENAKLPPAYIGDDLRLRQILFNLVGNAIKFTKDGTVSILIELDPCQEDKCEEQTLHFSVIDSGIGIAADKLEKIFNSFEQADSSYVRSYGGTGLGLAISRQLAEIMGGKMWVESEVGRGSAFHFTVKLQPCDQSLVSDPVAICSDFEAITGLNVLIADDNEVNRDLARMVLENDHYVSTAVTGLDALHALIAKPFDVVLMDVQMPVMDGLTATKIIRAVESGDKENPDVPQNVVKRLREQLFGKHIPIIAMTAHAMGGDKDLCLEAGMDDYITKPFQPEQLSAALWGLDGKRGKRTCQKKKSASTEEAYLNDKNYEQASIEQVVTFFHSKMRINSEQMGKILAASHRNISDNLRKMKNALEQHALGEFADAAHSIKGTLLQCGLDHWGQEAQSLYDKVKSPVLDPFLEKDLALLEKGLEPMLGPSEIAHATFSEKDVKKSHGKILVMDDNELILEIVSGMLEALGYEGDYVASGEEAVAKYRKALEGGAPYDLVITDIQVPGGGMGGKDTAAGILEFDSTAKLLVSSGDSADPLMVRYKDFGFTESLSKPYVLDELSAVLERVCC